MSIDKKNDGFSLFDITDYLLTGEHVSEYLRQVIEDKDAEELVCALKYIDRSVGMAEITKATGMTSTDLFEEMSKIAEIHPGEILQKEFMKPKRITARKLALAIGLTSSQIIQICAGRQAITSDIALQLGKFFSMDPGFWMNLQSEYDSRMTSRTLNQGPHREINTRDIRTSSDPDLAGSYDAMLRAARSAEDIAIRTNTSILVSVDGKDVELTAADLVSRQKETSGSIEKRVRNVYADLEFPDADQMLRKAYLVSKISDLILSNELDDARTASLLGISKISLSKILKGQFRDVSEDVLSSYLMQVQKARAC
jgi:addiction module HigA family antidote